MSDQPSSSQQPPRPPDAGCYTVTNHLGLESRPRSTEHVFAVSGAGWIAIGATAKNRCGTAFGVSVECSWSKYGYSGGVMDRSDMARLRDLLSELLGSV